MLWEDIIENHNDPNEQLTNIQLKAYHFYLMTQSAEEYLDKWDYGNPLTRTAVEIVDDVYPDRSYMKKN